MSKDAPNTKRTTYTTQWPKALPPTGSSKVSRHPSPVEKVELIGRKGAAAFSALRSKAKMQPKKV